MDFLKKVSDELNHGNQGQRVDHHAPPQQPSTRQEENMFNKISEAFHSSEKAPNEPASSHGGLGDKINSMLGGGAKAEQKEDSLDKGIDWVQEHVFKQGQQSNESAIEQMKDKQIADVIRNQFHNVTGHDIPGSKHGKQ